MFPIRQVCDHISVMVGQDQDLTWLILAHNIILRIDVHYRYVIPFLARKKVWNLQFSFIRGYS